MTDRRQPSEIHQRRQVCARINELKSNCENLTQVRDNLLSRLRGLNDVADKLIDEKRQNKYDPNLRVDLTSYQPNKASNRVQNRGNQLPPTSTFATNDLINKDNLLYRREQISQSSPSDAFKIKLSFCLQEVVHKAEEIAELSEHLYKSNSLE